MKGRILAISLMAIQAVTIVMLLLIPERISSTVVIIILGSCLIISLLLYFFLVNPINKVTDGMNLLRAQDYASRLRETGINDTDNVVSLFNSLMERLKHERYQIEEKNLLLDKLIESSSQGIIIMDYDDIIISKNRAAEKMLKEISLPDMQDGESTTIRSNDGMIYRIFRQSFMDRGFRRSFYVIETLTDEVRIAERDAYGRIIRIIAHEVNNTMGGIDSVFQTLTEMSADDEPLKAIITSCRERSNHMSEFISAYASLVKLPDPTLIRLSLAESIESLKPFITAYSSDAGITVTYDIHPSAFAYLDPILWEQVMINIIKNSVESIIASGRSDGTINISADQSGRMTITDNGIGIKDTDQLFSPFFTTKPDGQGIGLMLISEILRRHRVRFSLSTDPMTLLTIFRMQFPRFAPEIKQA